MRPWSAEDGALVRVRLVGGRISGRALAGLCAFAVAHGDGQLRLTSRANLQLRALPQPQEYAVPRLPEPLVEQIEGLGLLPSRSHDLVRNIMLSPQSGLGGGRADLRGLAADLDAALRADGRLADLPAKFLFLLDDGRGDLCGRDADLGLVAVSDTHAQLRIGSGWGDVVGLADAVAALLRLAHRFLDVRGDGPSAAWHVDELDRPLAPGRVPEPALPVPGVPPAYGRITGGEHVMAPDGTLSSVLVDELVGRLRDLDDLLIVTPWRGVLIPEEAR